MCYAKILIGLATVQSALSIGVSLTQYTGGQCEDSNFISPIINIGKDYCNTFVDMQVGSSLSVDTFTASDDLNFSCGDGQLVVLQVWQSSGNCENIPDATIGALSTEPTEGGCIIMPVRSAQLHCQ
ncbi:hypothetical protein EJ02DRAFT_449729 [Clathrospora elynae]|uniref:Uncharacterized protein n=1 Tax=Clathrospora elynae TaxID=706981 RepID=A0A6A5T4N6_9PLEO|nr:hypothetical protein EJ02DRAFT_449729 [Clathrospora elynae]